MAAKNRSWWRSDCTETNSDVSLPEEDFDDDLIEAQLVKRIQLEKLDVRDQLKFNVIEFNYSIFKQEPVTSDEEKEKRTQMPTPKEVVDETPKRTIPRRKRIKPSAAAPSWTTSPPNRRTLYVAGSAETGHRRSQPDGNGFAGHRWLRIQLGGEVKSGDCEAFEV